MATTVTAGHDIDCTIEYLDQNGNPMLAVQTPDAPPAWINVTSGVLALTPSADGLTCVAHAITAGTDSIHLSVTVGGNVFKASLAVTVEVAPQVLTGVAITSTVN
jgi:hypothetical protein